MTVFLCSHKVTLTRLGALRVRGTDSSAPLISVGRCCSHLCSYLLLCLPLLLRYPGRYAASRALSPNHFLQGGPEMKDFPWVPAEYSESRGVTALWRLHTGSQPCLGSRGCAEGAWAPLGALSSPSSRERHQAQFHLVWIHLGWIHPYVHAG